MLILQRKEGESLLIGDEVEISVLAVEAGRVRLAIQAPRSVTILRSELKVAAQTNREAAEEEVSPGRAEGKKGIGRPLEAVCSPTCSLLPVVPGGS